MKLKRFHRAAVRSVVFLSHQQKNNHWEKFCLSLTELEHPEASKQHQQIDNLILLTVAKILQRYLNVMMNFSGELGQVLAVKAMAVHLSVPENRMSIATFS